MTNDGIADLAAIWGNGSLYAYPGDKAKGLAGTDIAQIGGTSWATTKQLTAGDFNGDGISDLMAMWTNGTLHLYKGMGDGQLAPETKVNTGGSTWATVKLLPGGDFNGDGIADLMAVWNDGSLHLYKGDGKGGIAQEATMWGGTSWKTMLQLT